MYSVFISVHNLNEGFLILTFQRVHDEYTSEGWTKHHTQMLEYEETNAKNPKPSITFEVAEPANDKEKNWTVTTISVVRVSYILSLFVLFELFEFQLSSLLHGFVSLYIPPSPLPPGMLFSLRNQLWIS